MISGFHDILTCHAFMRRITAAGPDRLMQGRLYYLFVSAKDYSEGRQMRGAGSDLHPERSFLN